MKIYNEKHDVLLSVYFVPVSDEAKEKEVVPHTQRVNYCRVLVEQQNEYNSLLKPIFLNRDLILDLANQINQIESETSMREFTSLPF